ncbi:MAG: hypothetical protein PHE25_05430 [Candidatus Gracilibacteria bacterium]|nr:hypothetical protein [Candidatus Gracilibacteria bacterium]
MLDALEVKFWDRLDNLETSEIYKDFDKDGRRKTQEQIEKDIGKAERKITETEKYFYKIALEFDRIMKTDFSSLLCIEVAKLKNFVMTKRIGIIKESIFIITT